MNLENALAAANAAQQKAQDLKIAITVSVVDSAGHLVLTLRGNGTGFLTPETSRAKAFASAAFGKTTKDLVELQKTNPAFWQALPSLISGKVLPTTGAVPIFKEGKLIGAIGCGGGNPEQDHECALAGAQSISEKNAR